jgi:hypothetical protein
MNSDLKHDAGNLALPDTVPATKESHQAANTALVRKTVKAYPVFDAGALIRVI